MNTKPDTVIRTGSAISVLNAIKLGFGSAIGTTLTNEVQLSSSESLKISVNPKENSDLLIRSCILEFEKITKEGYHMMLMEVVKAIDAGPIDIHIGNFYYFQHKNYI